MNVVLTLSNFCSVPSEPPNKTVVPANGNPLVVSVDPVDVGTRSNIRVCVRCAGS